MRLSVVTTLYNSAPYVREFYRRAVAAAEKVSGDFEIIMVDDGSPDNSLQIASDIAEIDARVSVIELSRNFGHHKAIMTGLQHARGDFCFLIDSDLEEDPALLDTFYGRLTSEDVDVVYGYQHTRKGGFLERVFGTIAYAAFDAMMSFPVPRNHITLRLMRRRYVESLLLHKEQQTVIGGLWVITGYRQVGLEVRKLTRGSTTYSLWRRWLMFVNSVASFSEVPLVAIFYLGLLISLLSLSVGIYLLMRKFVFKAVLEGWVSVMVSVWFLGGLLIFCVGVIGIYLSKVFLEVKDRPYTIVRNVHKGKRQADTLQTARIAPIAFETHGTEQSRTGT